MDSSHLQHTSSRLKKTASSVYALPLVVRYETLIAFISKGAGLTVKDSPQTSPNERRSSTELVSIPRGASGSTQRIDRASALNNILVKLQQWANKLSYESPTKFTAGPDVLEALEASDAEYLDEVHGIFSSIAKKVQSCPPDSLGDAFNWASWYQSLNETLLQLDNLVWRLRDEYERYLNISGSTASRPSLVLSLDGGGVRSYSTLVILQRLMSKIEGVMEKNYSRTDPLPRTIRPRDFFDYIFGTSSGGMIAIMLGRLRMTVNECIDSFIEFGNGTFARPRLLHNFTFLLLGRSKYGEGTFHKIIQKVVNDFVPGDEKARRGRQHTFAALDDKCKTGVWACASKSLGSQPCLFRTYNHECPEKPRPYLRNPGLADSPLVWSVARATSAAPYLFDEAVIGGKRFFDGGLIINNPSPEAYFEVDCLHHQRLQHKDAHNEALIDSTQDSGPSIAVLVSVGSGLRPLPKSRSKVGLPGMDRVTGLIDRLVWATWTSTERAHEQMERATWQTETAYYRFNVEKGIGSVRQDEWKKQGSNNVTLKLIAEMTTKYIDEDKVDRQLQSCAEQLVKLRRRQL